MKVLLSRYRIVGNKAELTDFWAVLRNSTL
jgi:hypothetical protein